MRFAALAALSLIALAACQPRPADNSAGGVAVDVTEAPAAKGPATEPFAAANSAEAPSASDQGLDAVVDSALDNAAADQTPSAAEPPAPTPAPAATPAPTPRPPAAAGRSFRLVGTEPFWNATLSGGNLVLQRPEHADLVTTVSGPESSGGGWQVWRGRWQQSTIVVRVRRATCSDGMSDTVYRYDAEVDLWGTTLRGCATAR